MSGKAVTAGNQCYRILKHLKSGKSITQLEAMRDYGVMRLSERIRELKARGENIEKRTITVTNRYGEAVRVAEYRLEEKKA